MTKSVRTGLLWLKGITAVVFSLYLFFSFTEVLALSQSEKATMPAVAITALEQIIHLQDHNKTYEYVEIVDSCGPYFDGTCVNVRSGPGEEYPVVTTLRKGVVLRVEKKIQSGNRDWYKIVFDEWLRYPERVNGNWYIASDFVRAFSNEGIAELDNENNHGTTKRIIVDRSSQKLYAYDGDRLFMEETISTGIELTPTPRGTFTIFKKTPSRYMQGPLPGISSKYYDLPGVPWNLYFTHQGAVIHGAYWHDKFGERWSSGCVNVDTKKAELLYHWADIGTTVIVRD